MKKELVDFDEMYTWRMKADHSFNYNYIYMILKTVYFNHNLFDQCVTDEIITKVLTMCADITVKEFNIPLDLKYKKMKHYFGFGENDE